MLCSIPEVCQSSWQLLAPLHWSGPKAGTESHQNRMIFLVSAPLAFNFGALEACFLIMVFVRVANLSEETPWFLYSCKICLYHLALEEQQNVAYCIFSTAQINNMQPIHSDDFEVELGFRVISGSVCFIIEFGEELGLFAV